MDSPKVELLLEVATKEDAEVLTAIIDDPEGRGEEALISRRSNLDGADSTWLLMATVVLQQVPALLTECRNKPPRMTKVGDVEVQNLTDEDFERVERLMQWMAED